MDSEPELLGSASLRGDIDRALRMTGSSGSTLGKRYEASMNQYFCYESPLGTVNVGLAEARAGGKVRRRSSLEAPGEIGWPQGSGARELK